MSAPGGAGPGVVRVLANEFGPWRRARVVERVGRASRPVKAMGRVPLRVLAVVDRAAAVLAVKAQLRRAGKTLTRTALPPELRQLAGAVGSWPEVVHGREDHGGLDRGPGRPVMPSAAELSELNESMAWFLWLDGEERQIAFAVAIGYSFRQIAAVDPEGRKKSEICNVFGRAVEAIVGHLARGVLER